MMTAETANSYTEDGIRQRSTYHEVGGCGGVLQGR
jgi:hypothetical protein